MTHEATQKRQTNKTGNLALKMSKVVNLLSHFRKLSCETFSAIDLWRLSQHCGARNPGLAGEDPSATAYLKLNLSPFSPCHNQYHVATVMMLLLNKNFHWIKSQGRKSLCRTIAKKNGKHNVQQKGHDDSVELNKTRPVQILASGHEVVKW